MKKIKLALIGYGNMGKLIHTLAETKGHSVVAIINSKNPLNSIASQQAVAQADVCLDFSSPAAVLENIKILSTLKKNVVIGTTGWAQPQNLPQIEALVNDASIGLLHAPNFSLGVVLFLNIIEKAAQLLAPFPQYEVAGFEMHHSKKQDQPSGTAKAIQGKLAPHYPHTIPFSSVRVGNIPGTHSVMFDSVVDTLTFTHEARNREGFAHGAIVAAEWLQGKQGIFTLNDLITEGTI
jgi:4-hydroxy-tetrahydrodipicolinate reductase